MPQPSPSGILNVDKPRGWTSHDVVAKVRRLTGQRRVGHAGTLDPLATGVLLLCVGQATRVAEYLMAGQKRYRSRLHFGVSTDTYDSQGQVTKVTSAAHLQRSEIEIVLTEFTGEIRQVPPMFSALKRAGVPLYKLAREGKTVQREPRVVNVAALQIKDWISPDLTLDIVCSAGTYVRSLAHDLGERLGCGAHVASLTRMASGQFGLEQAISLEALAEAAATDCWTDLLLPMDSALTLLEAVVVSEAGVQKLAHGQPIPYTEPPSTSLGRVYGPDGALIAIVAHDPDAAQWRPKKVFVRP